MVEEIVVDTNIYIGAYSLQTALGDLTATCEAMASGRSGLRYDARFGMPTATIDQVAPIAGLTRFEAMLAHAIEQVSRLSGVALDRPDTLLVLSTTKGNVALLEGQTEAPERAYLYASAEVLAAHFGMTTAPVVISNACISGVSAFVVARRLLQEGLCRHAIVAGCDELSEFIASGFASFKSISLNPCRPYDAARDGLSLGEAVGAVLLTRERALASEPCVALLGGVVSNDANHISGPSRTGEELAWAITEALREAHVTPEEVGCVNTHGTATRYNDEMESKALAVAALSDVPTNSLKGYIGHTLGASGVVESILTIEQLRRGELFATRGFEELGTPCPVAVSAAPQPIRKAIAVKTASGFGGCNAAIVFGPASEACDVEEQPAMRVVTEVAHAVVAQGESPFAEMIRTRFRAFGEQNLRFYKMSDLAKGVYVAVEELLRQVPLDEQIGAERRAIVLSNRASSLEVDLTHQQLVDQHAPEGTSPAVFVYTLPNVAMGEIAIRHRIKGDNTFFIEPKQSDWCERYARQLIACNRADEVICGWCEKIGQKWHFEVKLLRNV